MAFKTEMKIHFDEADPAGIAFSGGLFTKIHRCYEDFVGALDQDPKAFFLNPETLYPLRHFEGEYFQPLFPMETYIVFIQVSKISESSFQLEYLVGDLEQPRAVFRSTHVAVEKESFTKITLPTSLKQNLEKFVTQQ